MRFGKLCRLGKVNRLEARRSLNYRSVSQRGVPRGDGGGTMRWSERGITCATCRPLRPQSQQRELECKMTRFLVAAEIFAEEGQAAVRGRFRGGGEGSKSDSDSDTKTGGSLSERISRGSSSDAMVSVLMMVVMDERGRGGGGGVVDGDGGKRGCYPAEGLGFVMDSVVEHGGGLADLAWPWGLLDNGVKGEAHRKRCTPVEDLAGTWGNAGVEDIASQQALGATIRPVQFARSSWIPTGRRNNRCAVRDRTRSFKSTRGQNTLYILFIRSRSSRSSWKVYGYYREGGNTRRYVLGEGHKDIINYAGE